MLQFKYASEPNDIIHENQGVSNATVQYQSTRYFIIVFLVINIQILFTVALKQWQGIDTKRYPVGTDCGSIIKMYGEEQHIKLF